MRSLLTSIPKRETRQSKTHNESMRLGILQALRVVCLN